MKKIFFTILFFLMAVYNGSVWAEDNQLQAGKILKKIEEKGTLRVIVKLKDEISSDSSLKKYGDKRGSRLLSVQKNLLSKLNQVSTFNFESVKRFNIFPGIAMEVDEITLQMLIQDKSVSGILEDKLSAPTLNESTLAIDANVAWKAGYSGNEYVVAILDTGVNKFHSFLNGKVISEACYSTTYAPHKATSLCAGGVSSLIGSGAGIHCNTAISGCSHGTHVAGIAAGKYQTESSYGALSGVAKDSNIIAIQVFSRVDDEDACGEGSSPCALAYDSDIIRGLERVYQLRNTYKIAAANLSIGGGEYFETCDSNHIKLAVDSLRSAGIATVISSGNEGFFNSTTSPGCISSAITVGSTTKSDIESSFSNIASWVDLMAPGSSIASSVVNGYAQYSGTSMAAPHVTGAWAIMKAKNPTASVSRIESALESSGKSIWTSANVGYKPRIDLDAALAKINPGPQLGLNWDKCQQIYYSIGEGNTWCYLQAAKIWISLTDDKAEDSLVNATANNHYLGYNVNSINGSSFTINHIRVFKY